VRAAMYIIVVDLHAGPLLWYVHQLGGFATGPSATSDGFRPFPQPYSPVVPFMVSMCGAQLVLLLSAA
jgi:hypothetical protein